MSLTGPDHQPRLTPDEIVSEFPDVERDRFLCSELDHALIGIATQGRNNPVPLYSWAEATKIEGATPWQIARECQPLLTFKAPGPCVLFPVEHFNFWKRIRAKEIIAWDRLNNNIMGIGYQGAGTPYAVVYDFDKVILTLAKERKDGTTDKIEQIHNALEFFNTNIKPANWGDETPTFAQQLI